MQRNHAPNLAPRYPFSQDDVTAALSDLKKAKLLKRRYCFLAETRRSLDTLNLECRHQRPANLGSRELFQVELCRLTKVCHSFVNVLPLARRTNLRTKRNPKVILSMN